MGTAHLLTEVSNPDPFDDADANAVAPERTRITHNQELQGTDCLSTGGGILFVAMVPDNLPDKPAAPLLIDDPHAEALFAKYAARLTRLAEQHLSRRLTSRVGGEDVVQSVFRTFFRRAADGEFHIDSSSDLWKLLVRITLMKARAVGRRHTAGCRDVTAEVAARDDDGLPDALSREPGPQEAAMLVDEIEAVVRGLPELYSRVLELRLEGHSVADVAQELGVSRQTIYRALELLQQRLSSPQA